MGFTFFRLPISTALVTVLAGCAQSTPPTPALQATTAPLVLEVHKQVENHTLQLGPDGQASALERDRLDAFIADLAKGRPDALHVTVGGARADAQLQSIARMLVEDGVNPKKIVIAPAQERALSLGPVTVTIDLYMARVPPCTPWSAISSAAGDHSAERADLGCSDLTNFGAMIADPHDLVQGSTTPYADGTTSAAAVQRYHEDNVKPLPPSSGFGAVPTGNGAGASESTGTSTGTSNTNGGM